MHFIVLLLFVSQTLASSIGLTVPPASVGDKKKHSSLKNLLNCISYQTVKDDIVLLRVDSGDKVASQTLNLHIFDSEDNLIRLKRDISHELQLVFTNRNSPTQIEDTRKRSTMMERLHLASPNDEVSKRLNIFDALHLGYSKKLSQPETDLANEFINSHSGKSHIHVCFDNIFLDKSWSFEPRSRDLTLDVNIKNMTTIKKTNYRNLAKYFLAQKNSEFNENMFDKLISALEGSLNEVSESLKNSEIVLETLMEQEFKLRDINEQIYSNYSTISIVMLCLIVAFGSLQMVYFRFYFKKKKLV